ncbi:MAG: hypothetical protein Q7S64_02285 [bacterium]|nr:hypothetical protein [bacterium]
MNELTTPGITEPVEPIARKHSYNRIIIVFILLTAVGVILARSRVDGQPLSGVSALYEINRNPQTIPIDGSVSNNFQLVSANAAGKRTIIEKYSGKTDWAYSPKPLRNIWLTSPAGTYLYRVEKDDAKTTTSKLVVAKTNWPLIEKVLYETSTDGGPVITFSKNDVLVAINDAGTVVLLTVADGSKKTIKLAQSSRVTVIDVNEKLNQLAVTSEAGDSHFIQIYSTTSGDLVRQITTTKDIVTIISLNNEYTRVYAQLYPDAEIVSLDITGDNATDQQVVQNKLGWYLPEVISPNQRYLLFEPGDEKDNKLALYDLENHTIKDITAPVGDVHLAYDYKAWSPDSRYLWLVNNEDAATSDVLAYFYDVDADKITPAVSSSGKILSSIWRPQTAKALSLSPTKSFEQTALRFIGWIAH